VHARDDRALRLASGRGHLEVVKLLEVACKYTPDMPTTISLAR
jgi:hypothetical protein